MTPEELGFGDRGQGEGLAVAPESLVLRGTSVQMSAWCTAGRRAGLLSHQRPSDIPGGKGTGTDDAQVTTPHTASPKTTLGDLGSRPHK